LHGPWHRSDEPILKTRPGTFYGFLTSNPAPHIHSEGKVTLMFKGRSWKGEVHGPMTIGVATAPTPLGPYSVVSDKPAFPLELFGELEDPFLWCDSEGYKAVAKDMSGQTCGQAGGAVYVRSDDAIHWRLGDPPAAFLRQIRLNDGSTRMLGNVERPFLLRDGDRITHLCAATSNGSTGFGDATETWNMVVPVRLGKA
jgi:hypothetical protein